MKILITTDLYTVKTNGVVTSVKNLFQELVEMGHEVKILTLSETHRSYKEGDVYFIRSLPLGAVYPDIRMSFASCHHLIKELIEWKPDVIHSQCEFFTLGFAKKISRKTGAPIVHTYHTMYEEYIGYVLPLKKSAKAVVGFLSKLRLRPVRVVITPTKKVEKTLLGYGLKKPIKIIPTGINLEQHKVRIIEEERAKKRLQLGIPARSRVLLNLGRLGTEKNLPELIDYFKRMSETFNDVYFLIVGVGPAENELKELAQKSGVGDKIIFTGMVEPGEVHYYYQLGDMFVSASTSETQGLTYVEAAANGLPLLCREDSCLDDVILNGESGFTYNTYDEFIKGFEKITESYEISQKMGQKSAEMAKKFDKSVFAQTVENLYKEIID